MPATDKNTASKKPDAADADGKRPGEGDAGEEKPDAADADGKRPGEGGAGEEKPDAADADGKRPGEGGAGEEKPDAETSCVEHPGEGCSKDEYFIVINRKDHRWEKREITGLDIKDLARVDKFKYTVWLIEPGEERDVLIGDDQVVILSADRKYSFFTGITETTAGLSESRLTEYDREYLNIKCIRYETKMLEDSRLALIFKQRFLPVGRYNHDKADVLVLLERDYPDVGPDMFFVNPKLQFASSDSGPTFPKATEVNEEHLGITWQRWSRHFDGWELGIDGIETVLLRIDQALENSE